MAHRSPQDVTAAVLAELQRAPEGRWRTLMTAAVQHLHGFVQETGLTEAEFQQACAVIVQLGQLTHASHNEVVLMAGALGISALVCLQNNGDGGREETTANLLGQFWRADSPDMDNGASIVRSPTPGVPLFVKAWVRDRAGQPVAGARVDVWHASAEGFYENQDPGQAEMNLRGRFTTDLQGQLAFRSIKPRGYPLPLSGPLGALLQAQGRHNLRPAHIHFLIHKPGLKTQFAQVYSSDDPHLDTDVAFAVTPALIGHYVLHDSAHEAAPDADVQGPWYSLNHHFVVEPGDSRLPKPPISSGQRTGERPVLTVLERRP